MGATSGPGRPTPAEFAPFFAGYVGRVPESDVVAVLERQGDELRALAATVGAERESLRYGPEKWSVREVFGHLVDGERVFGHRAFCISRGDPTPLPSFDENEYVKRSNFGSRTLADLVGEFVALRTANVAQLRSLADATWRATGVVNGHASSVRALAYMMAGHVRHHVEVLTTRYLAAGPRT